MTSYISLVLRLLPILARHLAAYVELAGSDAALLARALVRRLIAATVALVSAAMALMAACAWLIIAVWNTRWLDPVLGMLLLLFVGVAVSAATMALRRWPTGREPLARLRGEWHSDQQAISELAAADELPLPTADA